MNLKDITDSWLNQTMTYLLKLRKPLKETELHLENRFETCLACPHMCTRSIPKANLIIRFCDKCKCLFPSLIFAYKKKCPDGRWDAIPSELTATSENK